MYKLSHVTEELGISTSTAYRYIEKGLLPEPVKLGERAIGWPKSEFEEFKSQISTGLTTGEILSLVAGIHAARSSNKEVKK